ncbi:MAG: DUF4384 domain-containing protein [Acidobacteriaceae bacterium]|nr:DUF4384 domain-containing protein [Acidobacteriaceae bacterium]
MRLSLLSLIPFGIAALAGACLVAAAEQAAQQAVEVTVELRTGDTWKPVPSQTVFHANDDIRFRLRSQIPGYLYVLNHESGGDQSWLYPRPEQQNPNRIEVNKTYLVPDSKGSFIVGGEPGFDITYWMITPEQMSVAGSADRPGKSVKPNTLLPRCRDELLKARGVCEDPQAGPHTLSDSPDLPPLFAAPGGLVSRDLKFQSNRPSVRILTPEPQSGSIIYALWIAHN